MSYIYDDFATDGLPVTAPTGQTWVLSGPGYQTAYVAGHKLHSDQGTLYAALDYGTQIDRISGTFSFTGGLAPVDRSIVTLAMVMDRGCITLQNLLHLIVSPTSWALQRRLDGGSFDVLMQGTHNLTADLPYTVAMEVAGDMVTVYPPQGNPVSCAGAGAVQGRYGFWEIIPPATGGVYTHGMVGTWHRVSMGQDVSFPAQGRIVTVMPDGLAEITR